VIKNLPTDITKEELDHLLANFGTVQRTDLGKSTSPGIRHELDVQCCAPCLGTD